MRWWLSAVFAAIAILTAVTDRERLLEAGGYATCAPTARASPSARRSRPGSRSSGRSRTANLGHEIVSIAGQHGLALFVFSREPEDVRVLRAEHRPLAGRAEAKRGALDGARRPALRADLRRAAGPRSSALPLHRTPKAAAVVAYAPRPPAVARGERDLPDEVVRASIWAVLAAVVSRARRRLPDRATPAADRDGRPLRSRRATSRRASSRASVTRWVSSPRRSTRWEAASATRSSILSAERNRLVAPARAAARGRPRGRPRT